MRRWARSWCESAMARRRRILGDAELGASAIVFAPHPDDETLACGATILAKRELGADVRVVFLTDGSASHAHLVPRGVLAALRRTEALAACRALGVESGRVTFLDLPDHELDAHAARATDAIADLLRAARPAEVFLPHALEPPADHRATSAIVLEAMRTVGAPVVVNEYPVWLWHHWPWTHSSLPWRTQLASARALLVQFDAAVPAARFRARKLQALACHRSQMTRLVPGRPPWPILADVSHGELLACFLREEEIFRRR